MIVPSDRAAAWGGAVLSEDPSYCGPFHILVASAQSVSVRTARRFSSIRVVSVTVIVHVKLQSEKYVRQAYRYT